MKNMKHFIIGIMEMIVGMYMFMFGLIGGETLPYGVGISYTVWATVLSTLGYIMVLVGAYLSFGYYYGLEEA